MEELIKLRNYVKSGNYNGALLLIDELEEMSLSDKINKICSFSIIILIHLIKQQAEKTTTRSWESSIDFSVFQIKRTNKRYKVKGFYANKEEMKNILEDAFPIAVKEAALEVFEGKYSAKELENLIDRKQIIEKALTLIVE
ncbi:MAG: DUF29 family protein [Bacteroidetes bacterium]|nr:DUF29 family protein [Bacteroidota bacterium]